MKIKEQIDVFETEAAGLRSGFVKVEENKQHTYIRKDGKKVIVPKKINYTGK
jgi:hypothetical protein